MAEMCVLNVSLWALGQKSSERWPSAETQMLSNLDFVNGLGSHTPLKYLI